MNYDWGGVNEKKGKTLVSAIESQTSPGPPLEGSDGIWALYHNGLSVSSVFLTIPLSPKELPAGL